MKTDAQKHAKLVRDDAKKYAAQFTRDANDSEFNKLIDRDVATLNRIADKLDEGDVEGAYRLWSRQDTLLRESINAGSYGLLTGGAAIGHTRWDGA